MSRTIIRSGVALLDDWLGGVREGDVHLLTGGTGSGKSTIALNFAHAALTRGERVAMLVTARIDDLFSHAEHLGVDLDRPLRDGRLVLLSYRASFAHSIGHAVSSEQVSTDLEHILKPAPPSVVVIDGLAPFVTGPFPVAQAVGALMSFLERRNATSLVTFPERLSASYDRSLEPLIQNVAAIIHLSAESDGVRRAEALNLRYASPASMVARFLIREQPVLVLDKTTRSDRPDRRTVPARVP